MNDPAAGSRRVKVVHLSTWDVNGGAARAAHRVHDSLRRQGVASSMYVAYRDSEDPDVVHYRPDSALRPRLARIVRKEVLRAALKRASLHRPNGFEHFRDDREEFGPEIARTAPEADIYHLHQITGFVDYRQSLARLAQRAPLVWTLHEMTPMTGGCHYAYDCLGFTQRCGRCPQLGSDDPNDLSREVWTRKRQVFSSLPPERLHIVCPSRWMAEEAKRSSLLSKFPISVIPYGLDLSVFRPRREARRLLEVFGIAADARVVLFLADYTNNRRKGFALLDSALGRLDRDSRVVLVSLGRDRPRLQSQLTHLHLGNLTEDQLIAAVYSMADVFVVPSLQDNLPNTVLESLACGTPVVSFRVGGIPDLIQHGENGLLVAPGDVAALSSAVEALLRDEKMATRLGVAARCRAEHELALPVQAERYLSLYRSIARTI